MTTDLSRVSDSDLLFRVEEIDSMFQSSTGWGSWMVDAGNERKTLVTELRSRGYATQHRYTPRSVTGGHCVD